LLILSAAASCSNQETIPSESQTTQGTGDAGGEFGSLKLNLPERYAPAIPMESVASVNATVKFHEGQDIYNNVWTRAYKELLGIDLTYQWVVDSSQYEQKLNASIMSGETPDMFHANPQLLKLLEDSDLIADLTGVYEQEASQATRDIMAQDPVALKASSIEGKLMGLPLTDASLASAPVLWIRQDWLEKLGMTGPTSMADVMTIAERFVKEDPDSNGQDDTIGLAVTKDLWGAIAGLGGFFNGYHAYPLIWHEKGGQLVYGSVQPEMRPALQALQEMYQNGLIDREFGVKDVNKISETIANSKCGMEFGVWWNPYQPLQLSQQNYPDAFWTAFPLPSVDEKPAKSAYSSAVGSFLVVSADYAHPEALIRMINFWTDNIVKAEDQDIRNTFLGNIETPDIIYYKYTSTQIWEPNAMISGGKLLRDALSKRDPSALSLDGKWRYQIILAYFDQGIKEAWVEVATYGEGGAVSILEKIAEERGIINQFYGAPTQKMGESMATLRTMEDEMITKIIMGDPIERFDQFVADWKKLGGDEIVAEVNDWKKRNP
jgi:putative aldouronate transport system substrate-binding protein